jgi:hypothetical protein
MILDSFERINRALPTNPAQAIGSAKELVEATAKTVLVELGVPFEEKTAKLPLLVDRVQRELGASPQGLCATLSSAARMALICVRTSRQ